jgi:hypothetical protein
MTYTIRDICNRFNVNEHTVTAWIRRGELIAVNVGTAPGLKKPRYRITEASLANFELLRSTSPPPLTPKRRRKRDPKEGTIDFY